MSSRPGASPAGPAQSSGSAGSARPAASEGSAPATLSRRRLPVSWRRLPGAARTGAALAGACVTVLVLLTAYTATGAAGDPPARIQVSGGRVFVPLGASSTSAFFDIANTGGSDDVLQFVSADSLDGAMLSRSVTNNGAGHMRPVGDIAVRAGGRLRMTPFGTDIMIQDPPRLKVGERITFDLWFRWSGRVRATAVVVPVGW